MTKTTITLGRDGNQPFGIEGSKVSGKHAEIVIDDNGVWTLRDIGSANGTFVRNEQTGVLQQVASLRIHPMTFICLGPDNTHGCCFYARQVLRPGDFNEELMYMNGKEDEFEQEEAALTKKKTYVEIGLRVGLFIIFGILSFWIFRGDSSVVNFIRLGFTSITSQMIPFFFDMNKEKKVLKEKRERFHHCPNPECPHKMGTSEIRSMDCKKCHCQ